MSKLSSRLNAIGIYNTYDVVPDGRPSISYRGRGDGRLCQVPMWAVWVKGRSLSPHYSDKGLKCFIVMGREHKQDKFADAKAFAEAMFPDIKEWVREPFGSYISRQDYDALMKKLREKEGA